MSKAAGWIGTLVCMGLSAACSSPDAIVAEGCVMQSGDRFVLTDVDSASGSTSGRPTTAAYELVGDDDELRAYVGKRVGIIGKAEEASVAEVREITPSTPVGTSGGGPTVGTSSQVRVDARKVKISSAMPTGKACAER